MPADPECNRITLPDMHIRTVGNQMTTFVPYGTLKVW